MNTQRTPPGGKAGSHPNLSQLSEDEFYGQFARKRKTPDCDNTCFDRRELTGVLAEFRKELTETIQKLHANFASSFEAIIDKQSESIRKLHEDLCSLKSEVSDLKMCNQNIQKVQNDLASKFSDFKSDHDNLCDKVIVLESNLNDAKRQITELTEQQSFKDQQGRINNLEISGIPQTNGENLYSALHKIAIKIGFTLSPTDVDSIHRVRRFAVKNQRKNPDISTSQSVPHSIPNIIVKFTQRRTKSEFLAAVRARRGLTTADVDIDGAARPIFINDHLTPQNKLLYGRARKLGKELSYKYIWLNDCKIFLRKNETSKSILIRSEKDLDRIK